jgi:heme o synthase
MPDTIAASANGSNPFQQGLGLLKLYTELGKLRLSLLVVMTTAAGYLLSQSEAVDWQRFGFTIGGTLLAAMGANALNQFTERKRDVLMHRTQHRPLPSGRISPLHGLITGLVLALGGDLLLWLLINPLTAGLALAIQVIYIALYTPMKVVSPTSTLVGAVTGAIPPLMGFSAATGRLDGPAWVLAVLLFVWQIPHFLALAWMFREDYARGGYRMLPLIDEGGAVTCRMLLVYTLVLVPVVLVAVLVGLSGYIFAIGAVLLTLLLLWVGARLWHIRTVRAARMLFIASVLYLPLVLILMVSDRGPVLPIVSTARAGLTGQSSDGADHGVSVTAARYHQARGE